MHVGHIETVIVDNNQYSTFCKINVSETSMKVRHGSKTPSPDPLCNGFPFFGDVELVERSLTTQGVRAVKNYQPYWCSQILWLPDQIKVNGPTLNMHCCKITACLSVCNLAKIQGRQKGH